MADAPKKEEPKLLLETEAFEIEGKKFYVWEIIFLLFFTGVISTGTLSAIGIDLELLWETIFPYVFLINVVGIIIAILMFLKLKSTKAKIKALEDDSKKKFEDKFIWVKDKPKTNPRWEKVEKMAQSNNQSDWRMAILESDSMLDELIQKLGYTGKDMGERMLSMNSVNFPYIEEAWRVHKLRNIIAHETSYDLQKGEMEDAIDVYSMIFKTNDFI